MAKLGFRTIDEMIGKSQFLKMKEDIQEYKFRGINLDKILYKPDLNEKIAIRNTENQNHNLENVLDFKILKKSRLSIEKKIKLQLEYKIKNTDRAVGRLLATKFQTVWGKGLPKNTLNIDFYGSAGQSFGAFATKGIKFTVFGNTNDYLGKGLSGATLVVKKPKNATFSLIKILLREMLLCTVLSMVKHT